MGIVVAQVAFENQVPNLATIAATIARRTGLRVNVTNSPADIKGDLYDLHGNLAFACAPGETIEVRSYRPGAVKAFYEASFGDAGAHLRLPVQGLHETPDARAVYLQG